MDEREFRRNLERRVDRLRRKLVFKQTLAIVWSVLVFLLWAVVPPVGLYIAGRSLLTPHQPLVHLGGWVLSAFAVLWALRALTWLISFCRHRLMPWFRDWGAEALGNIIAVALWLVILPWLLLRGAAWLSGVSPVLSHVVQAATYFWIIGLAYTILTGRAFRPIFGSPPSDDPARFKLSLASMKEIDAAVSDAISETTDKPS